jgi:hypothetical protein
MSKFVSWSAPALGALVLMAAASPVAAEDQSSAKALKTAGVDGDAMAEDQLAGDRGGAGLLGLPEGSTTFAQIGDQTKTNNQPGTPGSSTMVFSLGGTSLSGSASLGTGGDFSFISGTNWSQTLTTVTSHSF